MKNLFKSSLSGALTAALLATLATTSLVGCMTTQDDDLLEPACGGKCDGADLVGFEVFKGQDGKFYFHLVSGNGKIVLQSQAYTTKASAKNGAESVSLNGVDAENYRVLEAKNGEWYVNLYAGNGQVIATTETYTRKYNAKRAIDSAITLAIASQPIRAAHEGNARFQTIRGADQQFYFHLRAGNGEIMLQSEGYTSPAGLENGIASVRENGVLPDGYQVLEAADGQYYFRLRAPNNKIIARGETYASKYNAERAVARLQEILANELVADPIEIPAAPTRSLADYPSLVVGLPLLADVAAAGQDDLQYFGYAEATQAPSGLDCLTMTGTEAADAFAETLVEIIEESGLAPEAPELQGLEVDEMAQDFKRYFSSDVYRFCADFREGTQTMSSLVYLTAVDGSGPALAIELGYKYEN